MGFLRLVALPTREDGIDIFLSFKSSLVKLSKSRNSVKLLFTLRFEFFQSYQSVLTRISPLIFLCNGQVTTKFHENSEQTRQKLAFNAFMTSINGQVCERESFVPEFTKEEFIGIDTTKSCFLSFARRALIYR